VNHRPCFWPPLGARTPASLNALADLRRHDKWGFPFLRGQDIQIRSVRDAGKDVAIAVCAPQLDGLAMDCAGDELGQYSVFGDPRPDWRILL